MDKARAGWWRNRGEMDGVSGTREVGGRGGWNARRRWSRGFARDRVHGRTEARLAAVDVAQDADIDVQHALVPHGDDRSREATPTERCRRENENAPSGGGVEAEVSPRTDARAALLRPRSRGAFAARAGVVMSVEGGVATVMLDGRPTRVGLVRLWEVDDEAFRERVADAFSEVWPDRRGECNSIRRGLYSPDRKPTPLVLTPVDGPDARATVLGYTIVYPSSTVRRPRARFPTTPTRHPRRRATRPIPDREFPRPER